MSAEKLDFVLGNNPCECGADFNYSLIWQRESPAGSGTYVNVDLTGFTAKMQVRKSIGSAVIVELSSANGRIAIDTVNAKITLTLTATQTNLLPPGLYKYDLELTSAGGAITRFIYGNFEIIGQITA